MSHAKVKPQYDAYGYDSGLWILFDRDGVPAYENLALALVPEVGLSVGQMPDWDNESYDENGFIDAERVDLGIVDGVGNPYALDEEADKLLAYLRTCNRAEMVW